MRHPQTPIVDRLSTRQMEIFQEALKWDSKFMAQKLGIRLQPDTNADLVGEVDSAGVLQLVDLPAGSLVDLEPSTTIIARGFTDSSTSTTLTDAAATFPVAVDGAYVEIVTGLGDGQIRRIVSHTATVLTIAADTPWTTNPDTTSYYEVRARTLQTDDMNITLGVAPRILKPGFAVQLNATTGVPEIQADEPITIRRQIGVQMPQYFKLMGATVYRSDNQVIPVEIIPFELRHDPSGLQGVPKIYELGGAIFLLNEPGRYWRNNDELEIDYLPMPLEITLVADTFLLPDTVRPVLQWEAVVALDIHSPTGERQTWEAYAAQAMVRFLGGLGAAKQARLGRVREVF